MILNNNFLKASPQQMAAPHELTFADYIQQARKFIAENRLDLTPENKQRIIDANSPFEYADSNDGISPDSGILLIHGLFDSPFIMRDLAMHFRHKSFLVRGLLLPGHGTRPGDLLQTTYQQWLDTVRYGLHSFKAQVKKLYVMGFSTGALLGIHQALMGAKIDGFILLSPGIAARSRLIHLSQLYHAIAHKWPSLQWLRIGKNQDYARYDSFPLNAVRQFYLLSRATACLYRQKRLDVPVFMVASSDDCVISTQAAVRWLNHETNPSNRLIIYGNYKKLKSSLQVKTIATRYVDFNIESFSHVCIPIAPDNAHYGVQGDYRNFQTPEERKKRRGLKAGSYEQLYFKRKNLLNLSYNPDFANLLLEIDNFIDEIA